MSTNKTVDKSLKTFDARKYVDKTDDSDENEVLAPANVRSHAEQIDQEWEPLFRTVERNGHVKVSSFRSLPLNVDPDASRN